MDPGLKAHRNDGRENHMNYLDMSFLKDKSNSPLSSQNASLHREKQNNC